MALFPGHRIIRLESHLGGVQDKRHNCLHGNKRMVCPNNRRGICPFCQFNPRRRSYQTTLLNRIPEYYAATISWSRWLRVSSFGSINLKSISQSFARPRRRPLAVVVLSPVLYFCHHCPFLIVLPNPSQSALRLGRSVACFVSALRLDRGRPLQLYLLCF